jgi:cytidylate kinase
MTPTLDSRPRIITIDGPAGAGKSTVARRLAQRLALDFLDTGAMYRGVAATAIDRGIDPADVQATGAMAESLQIAFNWAADPPRLKIDGVDVTHRLRDGDVTAVVSEIASNPRVRAVLVRAQRWIGKQHPKLVTEGRDQGSVVFVDAAMKFYLDASPQVRARRRAEQLRAAGQAADEQKILHQIVHRDQRDSTRSDGPLLCPEDAVRIDTSAMTLDEVVDTLAERVRRTLDGAGEKP